MIRNRLTSKKSRTRNEVDLNLTPMLDVIFILLIFFIVTSSFVQTTDINVTLSTATATTTQEASIHIGIDRHGDIWIENQATDIRTLQNILAEMYAENPQSTVTIFADEASDNASLVKVLDRIHRVGIENIAIAAEVDE